MPRVDLRLAVTDMPVGDMPVKIKCPDSIHKQRAKQADKQQSLAVYDDHLHCYGCGLHIGNGTCAEGPDCPSCRAQMHEALALLLGVTPEEAAAVAERYTSESLDAYRERAATEARRDPLPFAYAQVYNSMLMGPAAPRAHRQAWLAARGLTPETWEQFHLGHNGVQFTIPVFDGDMNLIALRFRRDDEYLDETHPKYMGTRGRNGLYLYGEWLVRPEHDFLVLCEGELDAVRLWQENIPAISATNGAGQTHKLPAMVRERWPHIKVLIIATDQDEPGQEAARITADAASELGFRTYRLTWEEAKDVTEAIQLGRLDPRRFGEYVG